MSPVMGDVTTNERLPASLAGSACLDCEHLNAPDCRFCANCGTPLRQACPNCQQEMLRAAVFCGHCGTDVQGVLRRRRESLEGKLAEAAELRESCQFERALALLRSVASASEDLNADLAERAAELIPEMETEQRERAREAVAAAARAEQLMQSNQGKEALELLEGIPGPLRTVEAQRAMEQIRYKLQEIADLEERLRESAQAGRIPEAAEAAERLLQLNPQHVQAQRLAVQLRDRLFSRAKKKVSEGAYAEAAKLLDMVAASQRDEDVRKLTDYVTEVNWLQTELRTCPVATKTLLSIAERLTELNAGSDADQRLAKNLQARLKETAKSGRSRYVPWAKATDSQAGIPVDWMTDVQRFQVHPAVRETWNQHPGCFFTACGLALQGLELADVDTCFPTGTGTGVFDKLASRLKRRPKAAWGLDMGAGSLKAVRLAAPAEADGAVLVEAADEIAYPKDLTLAIDEADRLALMKQALTTFQERHKTGDARIGMSISGTRILGSFFGFPPLDDNRLPEAVDLEARRRIPIPFDELAWHYHTRRLASEGDTLGPVRIAVQAVKRFYLEQLIRLCKEAQLPVHLLQSSGMALHNFARYEFHNDPPGDHQATALVDVGASGTNIVISSPTSVWFRNFGVGGNSFTKQLLRPFRLTRDKAELLKRRPASVKRLSRVYEELEPAFNLFMEETSRSLDFHREVYPEIELQRIYGIGGGMQLHGLLSRLRGPS